MLDQTKHNEVNGDVTGWERAIQPITKKFDSKLAVDELVGWDG